SVTDCRADKCEAALPQVLAHRVGFLRGDDTLTGFAVMDVRLADDELPDILIERFELLLYFQELPGIGDCAAYFEPVANDTGIAQQFRHAFLGEPRDFLDIEIHKRTPVPFAPQQNRLPTQPGLRASAD